MLSVSSPRLLGQHGSCSTAQQHVELSENILQYLFYKLPPQSVTPISEISFKRVGEIDLDGI